MNPFAHRSFFFLLFILNCWLSCKSHLGRNHKPNIRAISQIILASDACIFLQVAFFSLNSEAQGSNHMVYNIIILSPSWRWEMGLWRLDKEKGRPYMYSHNGQNLCTLIDTHRQWKPKPKFPFTDILMLFGCIDSRIWAEWYACSPQRI